MSKLKLTIICPNDTSSGGIRVIAIYAKKLFERGHDVTVVVAARPSIRARARIIALLKGKHLRPSPPNPVSFFRDVPFTVRWLDHPGPITDRDVPDADVVMATWWTTVEWVWSLSPSKGKKVHFAQDYEIWCTSKEEEISRIDAAYALPIPKIVIAKWVSNLLWERWGQKPISYIPNSVDMENFHSPERGKQVTPTVGFTYSPVFNKGTHITLAAIAEAREKIEDLRVVSFGISKPEHLPPYVEFHPFVPDEKLRLLYSSCDAWLFATRREGFGLPILEAMACRTPVIGTSAGAGRDLIEQGGGRLVNIDDASDMASKIVEFAEMPTDQWRSISNAALTTATSYSWDDATNEFEDAIGTVANTAWAGPSDVGGRPYIANPSHEDWINARSEALGEWPGRY